MHCPFDCPFLQESRKHETPPPAKDFPNTDIEVTQQFLREHQALLVWLSASLLRAALEVGAVDSDIRSALDSMIRTHRTLQSGLYYESRPDNAVAAALAERLKASIEEIKKRVAEASGVRTLRDAEVLGVLALLQRLEIHHNNGRRLSRAFVDFLRGQIGTPDEAAPPQASPSILL